MDVPNIGAREAGATALRRHVWKQGGMRLPPSVARKRDSPRAAPLIREMLDKQCIQEAWRLLHQTQLNTVVPAQRNHDFPLRIPPVEIRS